MVEGDRTHPQAGSGDHHERVEPPAVDTDESAQEATLTPASTGTTGTGADPRVPEASAPRRRGRWAARSVEALVVVLLAATAGAYLTDAGDRLGLAPPDPVTAPQSVEPPTGLDLPAAARARPPVRPLEPGELDRAAIARAVTRLASAKRLGRRVAVVVGTAQGRPVFRLGPTAMTPASTLKVLTATAALEELGPQHRFETRVVRQAGTLVLVGGGDPLLQRRREPELYPAEMADLRTLARRTAAALGRAPRLRLAYDTSLFSGPGESPRWTKEYVATDVVSPISSLWVDEGRDEAGFGLRVPDPALEAAQVFRTQLRVAGVRVGAPRPGRAAADAETLATVRGAPLVEVVQHVLETSDNEGAEVLARQVALARGRQGSFEGGAAAVRATLRDLGVGVERLTTYDGSGLSREDRIVPSTLVEVLGLAMNPDRPELEGTVAGLPVAGFSGSLGERFVIGADAGLGRVRAKTGTLRGIHGLAGVVTGRDGSVMTFAALTDRVKEPNTLFARARLDRIAAALAACRCAR